MQRYSGKKLSFAAVHLLISLGVVSGVQAQTDWQREWEKTVRAANKEGALTVYTGQYGPVVDVFKKEYPDWKVIWISGRGPEQIARVLAERRAGKNLTDIFMSGASSFEPLYQAKALDPVKPMLLVPEVTDTSKWWGGKHIYLDPAGNQVFAYVGYPNSALYYNSRLVDPNEMRSYWDLVQPRWKGKVLSLDPRLAAVTDALQSFYQNPEIGPDFLRLFFGGMDVTYGRDTVQITNWLASGKFAICFACRDVPKAKQQGLPVDAFDTGKWKEGGYLGFGSGAVGLLNGAPHPNAARVFINWLLSRKGQTAVQEAARPTDPPNSLRIDIPKDNIAHENRLVPGRRYMVIDRAAHVGKPALKLILEIMGGREIKTE